MLAATYLHSVNAREIDVILDDVEEFYLENDRLPGVQRWSTTTGQKEGGVRVFRGGTKGADRPLQEEYDELALGMEFLIAVKAVPVSSYRRKFFEGTLKRMRLLSWNLDQEVAELEAK